MFIEGHVHRVLSANAPVLDTGLKATVCEITDTAHKNSVHRAFVLNLPSPSPLFMYEFLVLDAETKLLFCTGNFHKTGCSPGAIHQLLFKCGPGDVAGNKEKCDEYTKELSDLSGGLSSYMERVVRRLAPTAIGVWFESTVFRHYFVSQNVLRAMCYASELTTKQLRGHEQQVQTFINRVESMDRYLDRVILRRFHELNDPAFQIRDVLASGIPLSHAAAAALKCFPGMHNREGATRCTGKHIDLASSSSQSLPLPPPDDCKHPSFFNVYRHLHRVIDMLEQCKKRHDAGHVLFSDCQYDDVVTTVQHLRSLGCVDVSSSSPAESGTTTTKASAMWMGLQWPRAPPVQIKVESVIKCPFTLTRDRWSGASVKDFYIASMEICQKARRRGAHEWVVKDLEHREKSETQAILCMCFDSTDALYLRAVLQPLWKEYGDRASVCLFQPSHVREVSAVFTDDPDRVIIGCLVCASAQADADTVRAMEDAYAECCLDRHIAPNLLRVV